MFEDLISADDGHPQMGRELKEHLLKAGFDNIRATADFDIYSTAEDVEFVYGFTQKWFLSPEITEAAIKYGASTPELVAQIAAAYDKWRTHPGALVGLAFGVAMGNKP